MKSFDSNSLSHAGHEHGVVSDYGQVGDGKGVPFKRKQTLAHPAFRRDRGRIRFGIAKRPDALRSRMVLEDFLLRTEVVAWDSLAARSCGILRAQLTVTGQVLSALDTMIAAHAIALGATLITHDRALLRLSPYLPVEDWATDI